MYVVSYMVELENLHCHVIITSISERYLFVVDPSPIHYIMQKSSTLSLKLCHFSHQVEELREHPASHSSKT